MALAYTPLCGAMDMGTYHIQGLSLLFCLESAFVERCTILLWGVYAFPKLARNLRCQAAEDLAVPGLGKEFYRLKLIP